MASLPSSSGEDEEEKPWSALTGCSARPEVPEGITHEVFTQVRALIMEQLDAELADVVAVTAPMMDLEICGEPRGMGSVQSVCRVRAQSR